MKYAEEKLASIIMLFVNKILNQDVGGRKRKSDLRIQERPMTLQLVGHFTPVIKSCPKLFARPAIMEVFVKLSKSCLESTKLNHPEFFHLLDSHHLMNPPHHQVPRERRQLLRNHLDMRIM